MHRFPLTGFDSFLLAIEKHDVHQGTSGNTCRYVMELEGGLSIEEVQEFVSKHQLLRQLASLRLNKPFLKAPYWEKMDTVLEITIAEYHADELLPIEVLNSKLQLPNRLIAFDLVHRSSGNTTFIFSWHHLLMDGFGAALLLKQLFVEAKLTAELSMEEQGEFNFKTLKQATKAKFFVDETSKRPLSGVTPKKISGEVHQQTKVISFTEEETRRIHEQAKLHGARFGLKSFLLACSASAVKSLLESRGEEMKSFWIPVPRDDRKKGATGPIVGNWLSFLFYRLKKNDLQTITAAVKAIDQQMFDQVKNQMPQAYNRLMGFMKWLPSSVYYYLVKRKGNDSLSSFLFTMAAPHPTEVQTIFNWPIRNVLSWPPNTFPPGLTFAFQEFDSQLNLMVLYYQEVVSEDEFLQISTRICNELLTGKSS